jgi:hypothetical protein
MECYNLGERCLPFGLSTAPFLFNSFAVCLRWILTKNLDEWSIHHYLDDFIFIVATAAAGQGYIKGAADSPLKHLFQLAAARDIDLLPT